MGELNLRGNTRVYSVRILDDAQILYLTTGLAPSSSLPALGPLGNAVDGVDGVAKDLHAATGHDVGFCHLQRVMQCIELCRVVGSIGIVKPIPQLDELPVAINNDSRASVTWIGIAGAVAVDLHAVGGHGKSASS